MRQDLVTSFMCAVCCTYVRIEKSLNGLRYIHDFYPGCPNSERVFLYRKGILTRTFQWDESVRRNEQIAKLAARLTGER